jgi:ABC-type branched-subunit amino acid transport system substrate-binding protein
MDMRKLIFILLITLVPWSAPARLEQPAHKGKKPTIVVLYTAEGDKAEEIENLADVAQFAFDQYNKENHLRSDFNLVPIDDKDDPENAANALKKVAATDKPLAVVGPVYSNVAMGLKDYINESKIPMVSIFATHNDLTKNSNYIFRICASNKRLVKAMADYLVSEMQRHHLNITVFKDLSDDYSMDLADTFRMNLNGLKSGYNEILFRGLNGIERMRDLNSQIWSPTKKDILFLPVRDIIAGHIIAALETEPYMVAAIDPVNFLNLMSRIKKETPHIRLVTTSQWLPQKSAYSKQVEAAFEAHFHRAMTISSALTYDAAYTVAAAYQRSMEKSISLTKALRDGTRITGVTGLIYIDHDGERVFSDQFLKEEVIE